jgi:hypothetical protein
VYYLLFLYFVRLVVDVDRVDAHVGNDRLGA